GEIVEANFAAAGLFGVGRRSLIGKSLAAFLTVDSSGEFHLFARSLYTSGINQACELSCQRPDGSVLPVRLQGIAPIGKEGARDRASIAIMDLSEIVTARLALA